MHSFKLLVALTFLASAAPSIAAPLPLNILDIAKAEKGLACTRYGLCGDSSAQPAVSKRDLGLELERRGLSLGPLFKFGVSFLPVIADLFGGGAQNKRGDATGIDWAKMAEEMEKSGTTQEDLDQAEAAFAEVMGSISPSASLSARGADSSLSLDRRNIFSDLFKKIKQILRGNRLKRDDSHINDAHLVGDLDRRNFFQDIANAIKAIAAKLRGGLKREDSNIDWDQVADELEHSGATQEELNQAEAALAQMMGENGSSLSARDLEARRLQLGGLLKGLAGTIFSIGGPIVGQILSGSAQVPPTVPVAPANAQVEAEAAPTASEGQSQAEATASAVAGRSISDLD